MLAATAAYTCLVAATTQRGGGVTSSDGSGRRRQRDGSRRRGTSTTETLRSLLRQLKLVLGRHEQHRSDAEVRRLLTELCDAVLTGGDDDAGGGSTSQTQVKTDAADRLLSVDQLPSEIAHLNRSHVYCAFSAVLGVFVQTATVWCPARAPGHNAPLVRFLPRDAMHPRY